MTPYEMRVEQLGRRSWMVNVKSTAEVLRSRTGYARSRDKAIQLGHRLIAAERERETFTKERFIVN